MGVRPHECAVCGKNACESFFKTSLRAIVSMRKVWQNVLTTALEDHPRTDSGENHIPVMDATEPSNLVAL